MDTSSPSPAELKYPWEQEIEDAQAAQEKQARRLEKAVEKNWKSSTQRRIEVIGEQGLDWWLYLHATRTLSIAFSLASLLAIPKLALIYQGTSVQQRDPFAWICISISRFYIFCIPCAVMLNCLFIVYSLPPTSCT